MLNMFDIIVAIHFGQVARQLVGAGEVLISTIEW
jgi:hypothetical protein